MTAPKPRDFQPRAANAQLTKEQKIELHRQMVRIPASRNGSSRAYQAKKIGVFSISTSAREAVAVGCCSLMGKHDHVNHRLPRHGHAIASAWT